MDERFGGKKLWIGLVGLAMVFGCILLIGLAAVAVMVPRAGLVVQPPAPVVVQPPAADGGAVQPPAYSYVPSYPVHRTGRGLLGGLFFGIGLIFKLLFLGLFLALLLGLVRRFFWGRRHCYAPYWGMPPQAEAGKGGPPPNWGPRAWHHHRHHRHWGPPPWWGPAPEAGSGEGESESGPESPEYTGPQE